MGLEECTECLFYVRNSPPLELLVFLFKPTFLHTKEFDHWWSQYQKQYFSATVFLQALIDAFEAREAEAMAANQPHSLEVVEVQPLKYLCFLSIFEVDYLRRFLWSYYTIFRGESELQLPRLLS